MRRQLFGKQRTAHTDQRNEGREDDKKIVPVEPGNRPEIVAALVADDETSKQ